MGYSFAVIWEVFRGEAILGFEMRSFLGGYFMEGYFRVRGYFV